jgi:hypothetical protein
MLAHLPCKIKVNTGAPTTVAKRFPRLRHLPVDIPTQGAATMSIIDTPANTTSKLGCLKTRGVTTVIRYYNFRNSQQLPDKRLDPPEAQALAAS